MSDDGLCCDCVEGKCHGAEPTEAFTRRVK